MQGDEELVPLFIPVKKVEPEPEPVTEPEFLTEVPDEPPPDPYLTVINKFLKTESPDVRQAIAESPCFGRMWFVESGPEQGECPQRAECYLATRCRSAFESVVVSTGPAQVPRQADPEFEGDEDYEPPPMSYRFRKKKDPKKRKVRDWSEVCAERGTAVSRFVEVLRERLNYPPELPELYSYSAMNTYEDRITARMAFVRRYGEGFVSAFRHSYWTLFWSGLHVCRINLQTSRFTWIECNPWLAAELRNMGYKLEEILASRKTQLSFPVYVDRVSMRTFSDAENLANAIGATVLKMDVRKE